jgi:phosphohistidine phosphatase SixA
MTSCLYKAKPKDYLKIIEGLSDRYVRILLVGHNPAVEETMEVFTGLLDITMSACALAHLRVPIEKWSDLKQEKKQYQSRITSGYKTRGLS